MAELSIGANIAWQIAAHEASSASFQFIEQEHIFIGLCSLEKVVGLTPEESGLSSKDFKSLGEEYAILHDSMKKLGLDMTRLRRRMRERLGTGNYKRSEKVIHRSESCKKMFGRAYELAVSGEISSLHLFASIMENPGGNIIKVLGLDENSIGILQRELKAIIGKTGESESATSYLDRFGRDLTEAAKQGRLGPFVGRRNELLQVIQTLTRSMKNNPVLIGEAGTGKTAIVDPKNAVDLK